MSSRQSSLLTEILPPEDRAIEQVVARYQRVAGAVTRFARSLCGNDELRVRLGSDAASSENEVVVNPGIFQAAYARRAPVTPDEVALASALHEVVHLVSTDLEERRPLPPEWFSDDEELAGGDFDLLDALVRAGGGAAESLFFALEDARQERQGMTMYPGARSVLTDLYQASTRQALSEARPLGQFAISCFLLLGDHVERDTLERQADGRVAVALADAAPFLDAAAEADDPWEIGTLALQLLNVAKLHRIVTLSSETETAGQQKAREELDQSAIAEGVDRIRLATPILQDAEGYEHTKKAADARAGESMTKGPSEIGSQEATDQILRVSQSPTVFLPSGQGGKLVVTPFPARFRQFASHGRTRLSDAAAQWGVAQRHISGELYPLFAANQRRGLHSGYDAGDLSPHAPLLLAGGLYERMYERRAVRTRRSYAVSLLVDGSASMLQPRSIDGTSRKAPWGLAAASLGAWSLARLCDELQIEFEVAVFNRSFAALEGDSEWEYTRRASRATSGLRRTQGTAADRLSSTVNHYLVKPFGQRWRSAEDLMAGLFFAAADPRKAGEFARKEPKDAPPVSMFSKGANVDEFNIAYAGERLARSGATERVLVVLADGMTRGSVSELGHAVSAVEASGTIVIGIGIGDDTVEVAYHRWEVVERPETLARSMIDGVRGALRHSLASMGMDAWWLRAANATDQPWKETTGV